MRNKDVLFVANAPAVEVTKFLQHIRVLIATGNDAVVLGQNVLILRNLINQ
jgi:polysaccharide export outer membrane protein